MKKNIMRTLVAVMVSVATLGTTVMAAPATEVVSLSSTQAPYMQYEVVAKSGQQVLYNLQPKNFTYWMGTDTCGNAELSCTSDGPSASKGTIERSVEMLNNSRYCAAAIMEFYNATLTGDSTKFRDRFNLTDLESQYLESDIQQFRNDIIASGKTPAGDAVLVSASAAPCSEVTSELHYFYDSGIGYFSIACNVTDSITGQGYAPAGLIDTIGGGLTTKEDTYNIFY